MRRTQGKWLSLWIVVAGQSGLRIFKRNSMTFGSLELNFSLDHPEGRLKDFEFKSDKPGRSFNSHSPERSSYQPHQFPSQQEANLFANQIGAILESGRCEGRFEKLVLVAGPEFLGRLKNAIPSETRAKIARTVSKNLTPLTDKEISDMLLPVCREIDRDERLKAA